MTYSSLCNFQEKQFNKQYIYVKTSKKQYGTS